MGAEIPTIGHRRYLEDAFKLLQQKQAPAVGVTDASGRLVGLVTSETIAEMMMLQDILPNGVRAGPGAATSRGVMRIKQRFGPKSCMLLCGVVSKEVPE